MALTQWLTSLVLPSHGFAECKNHLACEGQIYRGSGGEAEAWLILACIILNQPEEGTIVKVSKDWTTWNRSWNMLEDASRWELVLDLQGLFFVLARNSCLWKNCRVSWRRDFSSYCSIQYDINMPVRDFKAMTFSTLFLLQGMEWAAWSTRGTVLQCATVYGHIKVAPETKCIGGLLVQTESFDKGSEWMCVGQGCTMGVPDEKWGRRMRATRQLQAPKVHRFEPSLNMS